MSSSLRFVVLLVLLLVGGVVVNAWAYLGEVQVQRKELNDFPKQVGTWQQHGGEQRFDNATLDVLRASDYMMREYRNQDGRGNGVASNLDCRVPARVAGGGKQNGRENKRIQTVYLYVSLGVRFP